MDTSKRYCACTLGSPDTFFATAEEAKERAMRKVANGEYEQMIVCEIQGLVEKRQPPVKFTSWEKKKPCRRG